MTALFRKDFHRILRVPTLLALLVLGFVFGILDQLMVIFGTSIMTMFLAFGHEAEEHHHPIEMLINGFPIARKKVIRTKYMEGLLFSVVGFLLAVVFSLIFGHHSYSFLWSDFFFAVGISLLMLAVVYPFHVRSKRILLYICYFCLFLLLIILNNVWVYVLHKPHFGLWAIALFLFSLLCYSLSGRLTLWLYERKDL